MDNPFGTEISGWELLLAEAAHERAHAAQLGRGATATATATAMATATRSAVVCRGPGIALPAS